MSKKVSGFTLTNILKKLDDLSEKIKAYASFRKIHRHLETVRKTNIYKKNQGSNMKQSKTWYNFEQSKECKKTNHLILTFGHIFFFSLSVRTFSNI